MTRSQSHSIAKLTVSVIHTTSMEHKSVLRPRLKQIPAIVAAMLAMASWDASAQIAIVKDGKATGRIVTVPSSDEKEAAALMQDFVRRMSGAGIGIVPADGSEKKGDIIFMGTDPDSGLAEDAFSIRAGGGKIYITSGGGNGSTYATVTILEKLFGVRMYAADALCYDHMEMLSFPEDLDISQTPTFRYRQTQSYSLKDPLYKKWFRLEEPSDVFAGNLWVHTFNHILPASTYGKEHPEYYSYINGERRPGRASQWCLTNPEVLELACQKIDSIFKADPGKDMISVSQNDGNDTYCQCPACMEVIEREGAVSGLYIEFLNKIAARFPDKEFSTLAYLFTMNPPRHVKPLPNVNIMLCDIDCDREVPLTDNASGQYFMKALEGWSAISNNIFVWDYGINFDNMVAPFPNFHIIQPNIRTFRDHHVTMHFSQIAGTLGTDLSEMRSYIVSKLMWDADADVDSLMREFTDGYYGAAGRYIYQYEKMLEGALLASGHRLWIYDSPVSHKDGMLNAACRKQFRALFDAAEAAVAGQPEYLGRVRRSRLPLQYSELEIARAEGRTGENWVRDALALFEERTREAGIPTLNERNNTPAEYCRLYRERYLPGELKNKAAGATVSWTVAPTAEKYLELGETALTDGIYGGSTFVESWVGWEGTDGSFTVDLGKETGFSYAGCDFLHQLGAWILLPKSLRVSVSEDGVDFTCIGTQEIPEDDSPQVKFVKIGCQTGSPVTARYIRFDIEGTKICPAWHYGIGQPCWFFIDEVEVY